MADLTRFDFHVARFMNSVDVDMMSAEEIGQYILLLCKSWLIQKDATLPDNLEYLAKVARVPQVSELVLKKFPVVDTPDGKMRRNPTLYGEWLLAVDRRDSASERGKKGNETRYSERNSDSNGENNSARNAVALAANFRSPNPIQSNPDQSIPNQTKSSVEFSGGSFGQGSFKIVSGRWWGYFNKSLQKTKQNKEQYALACSTYGEDTLLKYLELWAEQNSWVSSHPKGGNRLYVFLQALPEMIDGDKIRSEAQETKKKKEGPQVSETEVEAIMQADREEQKRKIDEALEEKRKRQEFLDAHKDEI